MLDVIENQDNVDVNNRKYRVIITQVKAITLIVTASCESEAEEKVYDDYGESAINNMLDDVESVLNIEVEEV